MRAPAPLVLCEGRLDLEELNAWILHQCQRTFTDQRWDDAMIEALPAPVRVLESIGTLQATVGGNGFAAFLGETRGAIVRDCHRGLEAVGAHKLADLMGRAIGQAARDGAGLAHERARAWLEPFLALPALDLDQIDNHAPGGSYALLRSELPPLTAAYADQHRLALVDG